MAVKANQTLSRVKSRMDARHLMRYLRSKAGIDPETIAKQDGVSLKAVQESIKEMERYESANSEGQVSLGVRNLILTCLPQAEATITGLMTATNTVERKNARTGGVDYVNVEDKITRLEALKVFNGMISSQQPKAPAQQINVNQTNQQATVLSSAETTEERFRRLRAKVAEHNLLPPVVVGVPKSIDDGIDPDDNSGDEDDE